MLCYAVLPMGLAALYLLKAGRYADRFWTAVLPASYACYAMLPFVQTLPPRALIAPLPDVSPECPRVFSRLRAFNHWILRHGSIHVNTFPSGHVAASAAAALVLLQLDTRVGAIFAFLAFSIALGAVAGRYHYLADVIAGAAVALIAFLIETWATS